MLKTFRDFFGIAIAVPSIIICTPLKIAVRVHPTLHSEPQGGATHGKFSERTKFREIPELFQIQVASILSCNP